VIILRCRWPEDDGADLVDVRCSASRWAPCTWTRARSARSVAAECSQHNVSAERIIFSTFNVIGRVRHTQYQYRHDNGNGTLHDNGRVERNEYSSKMLLYLVEGDRKLRSSGQELGNPSFFLSFPPIQFFVFSVFYLSIISVVDGSVEMVHNS